MLAGPILETYQRIGFHALPVTINQTYVDYAIRGTKSVEHTIGEQMLKQLPQALEHPVAIIASQTQGNTSVVALLSFQHQGNTVIAPVVVDGLGQMNRIVIDSNAMTSIHGRSNAVTELLTDALHAEAKGQVAVFYLDVK